MAGLLPLCHAPPLPPRGHRCCHLHLLLPLSPPASFGSPQGTQASLPCCYGNALHTHHLLHAAYCTAGFSVCLPHEAAGSSGPRGNSPLLDTLPFFTRLLPGPTNQQVNHVPTIPSATRLKNLAPHFYMQVPVKTSSPTHVYPSLGTMSFPQVGLPASIYRVPNKFSPSPNPHSLLGEAHGLCPAFGPLKTSTETLPASSAHDHLCLGIFPALRSRLLSTNVSFDKSGNSRRACAF